MMNSLHCTCYRIAHKLARAMKIAQGNRTRKTLTSGLRARRCLVAWGAGIVKDKRQQQAISSTSGKCEVTDRVEYPISDCAGVLKNKDWEDCEAVLRVYDRVAQAQPLESSSVF